MKMSKKGSEFIQILKDAGVKEYWATSEFNLEEETPKGTIVLPISDGRLESHIDEVLNEIVGNEEDFLCNVWIWSGKDTLDVVKSVKELHSDLSKRRV